eukprot:16431324-Heterocapsa_arctica.AAC.1
MRRAIAEKGPFTPAMTLQVPQHCMKCMTTMIALRLRLTGKGSCQPGTWPLVLIRGTWDRGPEDSRNQSTSTTAEPLDARRTPPRTT